MGQHDCGCVTHWSDDLNHPLYDKACFAHKMWVPNGWFTEHKKPSRPREPVEASA